MDIGPKISVAGEKEFNDQLKRIQGNLKEYGSELNEVNKKFASNMESMDYFKEKGNVYSKQLDTQKSKLSLLEEQYKKQSKAVDQLNKELEEANTLNGENSIEATKAKNALTKQQDVMQRLKISINETNGNIYKLNDEVDKNTKKMNQMSTENKKAESSVVKLCEKIENQKDELLKLKTSYQDIILEKGKDKKAAIDLGNRIKALSDDLLKNVKTLEDVKQEADKMGGSLSSAGDDAKDASDGFTVMKGALANISADAIKGLCTELKNLVTDSGNASSQFAASTGANADSMKEYNAQMQELYKGNYGDSLDDIARSMAEVKIQTKEVDPSKLKELTKNAIVLRDTFDFDIRESMRAAKMLIDQFGISGDEAFSLIAQGAQNGLDKNGDLLDSINEYSVHYKQLGFTAEQFFNSLENGTASGTFSVDKLGDATKEFGIRVKDTTNTTTEGFQLVGLNADKMRKEFAKGGDSAQDAMKKTVYALFNVKDQVKQNQAGVALFGSMWEDLGIKGIKALTNVNGKADITKNTIKDINDVKYDNIDSQITELGRTLKTDLFDPTIKKYLPVMKDSLDWTIKNLPKIEPVVKTLGTAIGVTFAVKKTVDFKNSIADLGKKLQDLSNKDIPLVGTGMSKLGGFLNSNPWIVLAGAVAGLGTALYLYSTKETEATKVILDNAESAKDARVAWEELVASRDKAVREAAGEYDYYARLKTELQTLVTENGKVKEGYEGRVKYIINELNGAIGTEIKLVDGVVVKYKEQMTALDNLISKQRAKAIIDAGSEDYKNAISNQTQAIQDLNKAESDYMIKKKEYEEFKKKWGSEENNANNIYYLNKLGTLENELNATKSTYDEKSTIVKGYTDTISRQEYLQKLYTSGSAKDIKALNDYVIASYDDKGKKVILTTQQQITNEQKLLTYMKEQYKTTHNQMYADQIQASENRIKKLQDELINQTSTISNGSISTASAWEQLSKDGLSAFSKNSEEYKIAAVDQTLRAKAGINSGSKETEEAWKALERNGLAAFKNNTWEYTKAGKDYVDGVKNGINEKKGSVWDAIAAVGRGMLNSLKDILDINSPSREGEYIGKMLDKGVENGINKNAKHTLSSVSDLGRKLLKEASIFDDFGISKINKDNIDFSKELISNFNTQLTSEQNLTVECILDGKIVGKTSARYISESQSIKMKARGN